MESIQEARDVVQNLNQRMGPSAYDIACTAKVKRPGSEGPRWPHMIDWLLANQHPDGSWGGKIHYYHDRIICTLAAAIALIKNARHYDVQEAIGRAESY